MSVMFHVRQVPALEIVIRRKNPTEGWGLHIRKHITRLQWLYFWGWYQGLQSQRRNYTCREHVCVLLEVCARPCLSASLWFFKQQHFSGSWAAIRKAVEGKLHPLGLLYVLMHVSPKALRCRKEHSFLLSRKGEGSSTHTKHFVCSLYGRGKQTLKPEKPFGQVWMLCSEVWQWLLQDNIYWVSKYFHLLHSTSTLKPDVIQEI